MKVSKIEFRYRKCGRTGAPWSIVQLKYIKGTSGKVIFNMGDMNAEVVMNFYRKMEDHIKEVSMYTVVCDSSVLNHDHLN